MKEGLHIGRFCTVIEELSECGVINIFVYTKQSGFRSLISTKNEKGPNQEPCGIAPLC